MEVPLYALLVGIGAYPHESLPPLHGTANDVVAVRDLLVEELGVPEEHVVTLVDEQATRAGIEEAFVAHLHAHGRAWVDAGAEGPPPAFLFAFSGHGSQAPDPTGTEPDGLDETLVPYDGREDAVFDLKDHELAALLAGLPGDNITVVLDCCHSGSGTRHPNAPEALEAPSPVGRVPDDAVRSAPPDLRAQPVTRAPDLGPTRGVSLQGAGRHVLLAACRDHEQAFEHRGPDGEVRGAFTSFLVPALAAARGRDEVTYRELHQAVRFDVNRVRPRQTPVCEGDVDRALFSSRRIPPQPGLVAHVIGIRDGRAWFDVGQVHAVTVGSRLELAAGRGAVSVQHLEPTRCAGEPIGDGELPSPGTGARVERLELGERRWRAAIEGDLRDAFHAALAGGPLEGLLTASDDRADADLVVTHATAEGWVLSDAAGRVLVRDADAEAFLHAVAHVARVAHIWQLERPDLGPSVTGGVELSVRTAVADPLSGELIVQDPGLDEAGRVPVTTDERLVLEVRNTSSLPVHLGVIALTADWDVAVLHPSVPGAEDRLAAGATQRIGFGGSMLRPTLPDGRDVAVDLLRAVVTTRPASFDALELSPPPATWHPAGPLPPPLTGRTVDPPPLAAASGGRVPSRWATASMPVVVRRGTAEPPA